MVFNPIAFTIFGLPVHWYGLIIAFGLILALVLGSFLAKKRGFQSSDVLEWVLWLFPPAVICARLYYIIFNNGPWGWEAFAIWNGGIAIYGAVIGGAIGGALYCWKRKKNFLKLADVIMPCLILGQGIGRWGNFANQEAYGSLILDASHQFFPYAVEIQHSEFTDNAVSQIVSAGLDPNTMATAWFNATFFYESMADLLIFVILTILVCKLNINGLVMCAYFVLYGIARSVIEGFRTDSLMWGGIRASQALSIILIILATAFAVYLIVDYFRKKKVRGVDYGKIQN